MKLRAGLAALLATLALPAAASAADPMPLGHACVAQYGTRFCQGNANNPSWDGVPLDADVTLPATGAGPFPTIVMIHGYGGSKTDFETTSGEPKNSDGTFVSNYYHYNNVWFAQHGYAVLTYTARGFKQSCGQPPAALVPACQSGKGGYIHLKDQRVEAHDTQFLLGQLVDQGVADPNAIGTTGISYGGGESIELAYLNNRVRDRDTDSFSPWVSPVNHTPLHIAAAWPRWPWSDLVASLLPNGRFLDYNATTDGLSRFPIGIPITSYITGLYALGNTAGRYAPPGTDQSADITPWYARIQAGEPYEEPYAQGIANEIFAHHQGFGIPDSSPAPMLIENGWTDDLFPPSEALRIYNDLRAKDPNAAVSLQFGDLGHARGSNKLDTNTVFNDQGTQFFDARLKGSTTATPPAPGSVTTLTQTCPASAPSGGPFTAASWSAIHPGAYRFLGGAAQTVTSAGGDPQTAQTIDPITGSGNACDQVTAKDDSGTAVYKGPVSQGFTLMGRPTVQATIATTGISGQLDSRLWDIGPDGQQTLVSRAAYRLFDNQSGHIAFQLNGNGYRFAPGHTPKLELLGRDAPYLRPSNSAFQVVVSDVVVELPTLEGPGATPQIVAPVLGRGLSVTSTSPLSATGGGCTATASALTRARVTRRARGLRFTLPKGKAVTVDVFQQSAGRQIFGNRLVARFRGRTRSFTWNGRGNRGRRITDGVFVVRLASGKASRRVAVSRGGGRFRGRPAFEVLTTCGALERFKLERPVFGGPTNRALEISYRLRGAGTTSVRVTQRGRTVRFYKPRATRAGRLVRFRLASERVGRGDVRVTLKIVADGRTTTRTLVSRRL